MGEICKPRQAEKVTPKRGAASGIMVLAYMIRTRRWHSALTTICLAAALAGCKPAGQPAAVTAIVGAVLLDGTGGPPISNSVVTIEGARIRAVGSRTNLLVPADAEKVDGSGKFLVPGLIDLQARLEMSAGRTGVERSLNRYLNDGITSVRGDGAVRDAFDVRAAQRQDVLGAARLFLYGRADTRSDVARWAAHQVDAVEIDGEKSRAAGGILEEARTFHVPVIADIFSLAEARFLVDNGAASFLGTIRDTETIDPAFIARLRDLRTVFAPMLVRETVPAQLTVAKHNTKRLADGGVLIAVGSDGDPHREMELLVEAGLSPADVLAAATRHGALALGWLDQLGTIEPGKRADLLLLSANPAEDIRNLRKIDRIMLDGRWMR